MADIEYRSVSRITYVIRNARVEIESYVESEDVSVCSVSRSVPFLLLGIVSDHAAVTIRDCKFVF